jgi:hypothetical protein
MRTSRSLNSGSGAATTLPQHPTPYQQPAASDLAGRLTRASGHFTSIKVIRCVCTKQQRCGFLAAFLVGETACAWLWLWLISKFRVSRSAMGASHGCQFVVGESKRCLVAVVLSTVGVSGGLFACRHVCGSGVGVAPGRLRPRRATWLAFAPLVFVASFDVDLCGLFDGGSVLCGYGGWHVELAFLCDLLLVVAGFAVGFGLYMFGCGLGAEVGGCG